jgi:hypothetical protein
VNRKQAVTAGVLAMAAVLSVDVLGDLTQTRPDDPRPGGRSEIVFDVVTRDPRASALAAAQALWGACQGTIERRTSPADVAVDEERARVEVAPALGTHARQRLRGCLEDATLDRVRGDVVAIRLLDAP